MKTITFKYLKWIIGIIFIVLLLFVVLVMFKFSYLSGNTGYDIDDNNNSEEVFKVCDASGNFYNSETEARMTGLLDAQFGTIYCPEYTIHQSWDTNNDRINDCEDNGICDDSVDYSQPRNGQ